MILMLHRFFIRSGGSGTPPDNALNAFSDRGSIAPVAQTAMRWAVSSGLLTGSNNRLHPKDAATRATTMLVLFRYENTYEGEFTRPVSLPVPPVTTDPPAPPPPQSPPSPTTFSDVPATSIAFNAINWAQSNGYVTGSGGRFFPNDNLTRASLALILHRYAGNPVPAGSGGAFSDVSRSNIAFNAITWANENGIVTGSGGRFFPNDPITRESMVLMLYRYHILISGPVTSPADALNTFTDRGRISPVAVDAMRWAVSTGLMTGSGNRLFPGDRTTRAATVLVLYRYDGLY